MLSFNVLAASLAMASKFSSFIIRLSYPFPGLMIDSYADLFTASNITLYLGIRFNSTTFNRSAATNSLELAYQ